MPTGLLAGTIIGAGVFALPFVFKTAGLSAGIFYLGLGAIVYAIIHLMYADLVLVTGGEHRFVGLAEIYLGKGASLLGLFMAVVQMIFVMTIYLILSVSFLNLVFGENFDIYKLGAFWVLGSLAIFLKTRRLAFLETLIAWGMVAIIAVLFFFGLDRPEFIGKTPFYPNFAQILLPLGPIFFSLAGRVAIPSLVQYFRLPGVGHNHALIKRTVVWGTVLPAIVYTAFIFGILGLSPAVSEDSVSGLVGYAPAGLLMVVGILGILSLWSSYIVVGLDVKNTLALDLKISPTIRDAIVVAFPVILYLVGFQNFLGLVGFVGGIFLALESILVVFMWLKAKEKTGKLPLLGKFSPALAVLFVLPFVAALIYEASRYIP